MELLFEYHGYLNIDSLVRWHDIDIMTEYWLLIIDSQRTSYTEEWECEHSYPFAKHLSEEVRKYSPNAKIQWYLTWGRPYGDEDRCNDIPQVCTYEGTALHLCVELRV